jgi:hypothetical protein
MNSSSFVGKLSRITIAVFGFCVFLNPFLDPLLASGASVSKKVPLRTIQTSRGKMDADKWLAYLYEVSRKIDRRNLERLNDDEKAFVANYYGMPMDKLKLVPYIVAEVYDEFFAREFPDIAESQIARQGDRVTVMCGGTYGDIICAAEDLRIFALHERGKKYRSLFARALGFNEMDNLTVTSDEETAAKNKKGKGRR